jgi:glutaredoxin-like protein NrdH
MVEVKHVNGADQGKLMLYALSTCGWCAKTKALLNSLGVAYDYIDVDLAEGEDQDRIVGEIGRWNPSTSFPTLVIKGQTAVIGFKEPEIREALGL